MNFHGNVWFINFNGIGNGVIMAPILRCFEKSFPTVKYFHTENEILKDPWFTTRAGLHNIAGLSPMDWRKFKKENWVEIDNFIQQNDISNIINLRNEGPAYDINYYNFKKYTSNKQVVFTELDFDKITTRKKQENVTGDILSLFKALGTNISEYNPFWLAENTTISGEVGFGLSASHKNKRWSQTKWISLAEKLVSKNKKIILFPGRSDDEKTSAHKIKDVINQNFEIFEDKTLPQVVEKIRSLGFFISNDTGLLHIAVATNIPSIGIYTCTNPDIWAPFEQSNFHSFKNTNFVNCPSPKIYCGNCTHYYNDCPAITNYEDTIDPEKIASLLP